jgi:S1-C subfamily serine protease
VVTDVAVSLQNELDPRRARLYENLIESTTPIEPGFSGGALLDRQGRLIGLNVAVAGELNGDDCRGYAIPFSADIRKALAELAAQVQAP